jgi:hypothetical protein
MGAHRSLSPAQPETESHEKLVTITAAGVMEYLCSLTKPSCSTCGSARVIGGCVFTDCSSAIVVRFCLSCHRYFFP